MSTPFTVTTGTVVAATIGTSTWSLPNNSGTLTAQTTACVLSGLVRIPSLAAPADQFKLQVLETVNSVQVVIWEAWPQAGFIYIPSIPVSVGWDVQITKFAGTARDVNWTLYKDVGDRNALTIANAAIAAATFASGAITSTVFAAGAITSTVIASSAIGASQLATGAIAAATFAANAITSTVLAASAIGASQIASAAITAAKFATDALDANALAATAVTEIQTGLSTSAALALVQTDTTTLTGRLTSGRATNLDSIDAAVSSRAPSSTALSNVQWTNARALLVDNADVATSTRAAASTALSTAQWTNARATLQDNLDAAVSTRALSSTAVSNVDYTTAKAAFLDAAISGRAPASTAVSNVTLTSGRIANLDNLDTIVSGRASATALATVQADTDDIQARLPAALDVDGNIKAGAQTLAVAAVTALVAAIFGFVEDAAAPANSQTFLQRLRIKWSVFAGNANGLAISTAGTEHFRSADDSKDRATFLLGADGTRVTGTLDGE